MALSGLVYVGCMVGCFGFPECSVILTGDIQSQDLDSEDLPPSSTCFLCVLSLSSRIDSEYPDEDSDIPSPFYVWGSLRVDYPRLSSIRRFMWRSYMVTFSDRQTLCEYSDACILPYMRDAGSIEYWGYWSCLLWMCIFSMIFWFKVTCSKAVRGAHSYSPTFWMSRL